MNTKACSSMVWFICIIAIISIPTFSQETIHGTNHSIAIQGYDTVAYFISATAISGTSEYQVLFNDQIWQFSSAEHLNLFNSNPEKYIPQYDGKCAWAVKKNFIAQGNPSIWMIQNNHLYFFFSRGVNRQFEKDREHNILIANENWKSLLSAND